MELSDPARAGAVVQLGVVVRDLEEAIHRWEAMPGVGPFLRTRTSYDAVYRGRQVRVANHNTLGAWGDLMVELVEPGPGEGVARDWLEAHGEGILHIGVATDDLTQRYPGTDVAVRAEVGERPALYLDTVEALGYYVELIPTELSDQALAAVRAAAHTPPASGG